MKNLFIVLLLSGAAYAQGLWGGVKTYGAVSCNGHLYITAFPAVENPISEGSCWTNLGALGWNNVKTTANDAQATVSNGTSGAGDFKDSTAISNGTWGNDTQITTVAIVNNNNDADDKEMEHRHRVTAGLNNTTGYEFQWFPKLTPANCATQINTWNGTVGSFTLIGSTGGSNACPSTGSALTSRVVGTQLTQFLNGVALNQITNAAFSTGKPGIGFYYVGTVGAPSDIGFSAYRATDAPLISLAHAANDINTAGTTVAVTINSTGSGCIGLWTYWNSITATMNCSSSLSGAFTVDVGPTNILSASYRIQGAHQCGGTRGASDTITCTLTGGTGIDRAIAVSAIQGVTAIDQAPAINIGTNTNCTSTAVAVGAADTYLLGTCVFGGLYVGPSGLPKRFFDIESANYGGNVVGDGISVVNGASMQYSAAQSVSNVFAGGMLSFK